jgi:hypothetical protein
MPMPRVNFLGGPQFYNLQLASTAWLEAFHTPALYLVGSALERRDFRDVDVRCILDDANFDRLFPASHGFSPNAADPFWSLLNAALSEWMERRIQLPVDFQVQRQSQANAQEDGRPKYALGRYLYAGLEELKAKSQEPRAKSEGA